MVLLFRNKTLVPFRDRALVLCRSQDSAFVQKEDMILVRNQYIVPVQRQHTVLKTCQCPFSERRHRFDRFVQGQNLVLFRSKTLFLFETYLAPAQKGIQGERLFISLFINKVVCLVKHTTVLMFEDNTSFLFKRKTVVLFKTKHVPDQRRDRVHVTAAR